jgi:hypothetical protein
VTRFPRRRSILLTALLCQLATTVHVPMVHAMDPGNASATVSHCADHAHSLAGRGVDHKTATRPGHGQQPGHTGSCGCGLCQCPCSHAAALPDTLAVSTALPHLAVSLPYRAPDTPQLAVSFFRPPI